MSSILWATPSKEWTIAPKPKPGRKPKSDSSTPVNDSNDVDDKSRRIQNRAAQRAFRERKQSQLAELQARVQSYEQGQIERSVALQNIAKHLKEENESLRRENDLLKEKIARMEDHEATLKKEPKNSRGRSPESNATSTSLPCMKRVKLDTITSINTSLSASCDPYPLTIVTHSIDYQLGTSHDDNAARAMNYVPTKEEFGTSHGGAPVSCGFCSEVVPCLCNPIAEEEPEQSISDIGNYQRTPGISRPSGCSSAVEPTSDRASILDNLPAYRPAVPLPRKHGATGSSVNSIFPLVSTQPQDWNNATCSGDPSNCLACADDTFGKAFCTAIGESVALDAPCIGCPCDQTRQGAVVSERPCAGCRVCVLHPASLDDVSTTVNINRQTMPTNQAWKRIKAHPNAPFADLKLLAEVVARTSKCTGPTVVISPALGEATPERVNSAGFSSQQISDTLTIPGNPPPAISAQDLTLRCGRKKVREVYTDDVRTALHLLDAKFS